MAAVAWFCMRRHGRQARHRVTSNIEEGYVTPDVGVTFLKRRREPKPPKTPEKMQMHGTGRV